MFQHYGGFIESAFRLYFSHHQDRFLRWYFGGIVITLASLTPTSQARVFIPRSALQQTDLRRSSRGTKYPGYGLLSKLATPCQCP